MSRVEKSSGNLDYLNQGKILSFKNPSILTNNDDGLL